MMSDDCMNEFNLDYISGYIRNHLDEIKVNDIIKDENGNAFIFKGKIVISDEEYKIAIQPTDETWKKITHKEKCGEFGTYLDSELYKTVKKENNMEGQ